MINKSDMKGAYAGGWGLRSLRFVQERRPGESHARQNGGMPFLNHGCGCRLRNGTVDTIKRHKSM